MGTAENKQLVLQFLGHYAAARYDDALDMLAETCTWWLPGHPDEFPAAGSVDKATVRRRLARNLLLLPNGIQITTGAVTAEDDRVAIEAESKATTLQGRLYHNRYHFLFVVRDGKIQLVKEYLDTLHVREVLGGASSLKPSGAL
ncbi:MAG: nuclear transport factor 2 family protein [Pseudomonadota bacterium]|nr:nuclear transport factor 2 family protein [Pseudomonadota bacterium]